jgi:quercetin dioxygenase-like cupin family protein
LIYQIKNKEIFSMKKSFLLSLLVGVLLTGTSPLWAKSHKKPISIAAEELQWVPNPAKPEQISAAVVWGDMKKGAHGAFHKFKAGTIVENHSHSANLKAVVVAGTLVTGPEGAPKKMGPGSFFTDPSNFNHVTTCEGTTDCIVYIDASGKFDLKMAKEDKK